MRKKGFLWALAALPVFITGCSDDNELVENSIPAATGDEIVFGASASIEDGSPETRTEYGDKGEGYQIINWVTGDLIRISCAQAAQAKTADYAVSEITEGSTTGDHESTAATLTKQDVGLQWGTGEHTFYAVYPSPAHFSNPAATQPQTTLSGQVVTGVIPVVQTASAVRTNATANGETYDYIFDPDMDNAYMAARAVYSTGNGGNGVSLHFKPLVTAIEVEFNTGLINANTGNEQLTLTSIGLYSDEQDLAGSFSANISNLNTDANTITGAQITNTNESGTNYGQVTLDLNNRNVVMGPKDKCLMTFFIHPSATFTDNNTDMKLRINYTCNGVTTMRSYTIGKEIQAHKKYFFNNIILPDIDPQAQSSNWFSLVDDEVYISQLSIPGAGNAASSNYNGDNPGWYKEQTVSLQQLWNLGVRCFEFVSDRDQNGSNLGSVNLMCNNQSVNITFDAALTTLTNLLAENPRECLIIICNYQPSSNRNNQDYMDDFTATYGSKTAINGREIVKLEALSTAGDLRGKIAFIGRISQEGEDASNTLENVPAFFSYIEGWGSLKDKWNRRFGSDYYPGYNQANNMGTRSNVEDRLWSEYGRSIGNLNWSLREHAELTYPASNPDFLYNVAGGGSAWVQEWMRIVPEEGVTHQVADNNTGIFVNNATRRLDITWPGSYNEKYNNIVTTFDRAKAETGNTLYINSLCGYYVSTDVPASYYPYINGNSVSYNNESYSNGNFGSGGMGGDFATYNNAMNQRVYDYVLQQSQNNTTGPMGIVMMDYIGASDAGTYLPSLILQNNFKFPLRGTGGNGTAAARRYNAQYDNGGNAVSWE